LIRSAHRAAVDGRGEVNSYAMYYPAVVRIRDTDTNTHASITDRAEFDGASLV